MCLSAATMLAVRQAVRAGPAVVDASALAAGWASELHRPSVLALIATAVPGGPAEVTAFAVYQLCINIGLAAGPAVGGIIATHSFAPLFIGDAATSLIWEREGA